MAEFDTAGFSAVDEFFGDGTAEEKTLSKTAAPKPHPQQPSKTKRRGVGSAGPSQTDQKEDLAKRVLRIGKKRSRGDEEEEIDHPVEEDEEETGRTGISPKEKKPAPQRLQDEDIDTGKKKLGKKERKRLQEQQKASEEAKEGANDSSNSPQEGVAEGEVTTDKNEEATTYKKNKRRKVRSRQKNIRKDTRSSEEKPDYLVPGGKAMYQGRPMTEETREKLNLPKSKTRELFVLDRSPVESNDDTGFKLAVEDLLDGDGNENKKSSKPKKKKSKKKYKNL